MLEVDIDSVKAARRRNHLDVRSALLFSPQPLQQNAQVLHGMASCAEWTGVKLSTLLEETGIDPKAKWFIAEGADAPHSTRSVPLKKALNDAMIVVYQNGERLMPANGYPVRLWLPGYEGNMNVKYLRRIRLVEEPAMKEPGLYEISGIAYSGTGRISKVMVSADGGQSWAEAALQEPVLSKAFTRFRLPRSCRAVPGTRPPTYNRPALNLWPSAAS
jgi:sulfane dehydrogenase subunit SoxC